MDPSNKTTPGFEAPSPVLESVPPAAGAEILPGFPEQAPANAERASMPVPPPTVPPAAAIPLPPPPTLPDDAAAAPAASMATDDDDDHIEKAWVNRARQIVERTRDDPHKQSEELTVFKADYMKKRYGKTIKVSQ